MHQKKLTYLHARDGDHTLVPFECDLCIFRKLRQSEPNLKNNIDILLLSLIRRANLDSFWSTAPGTVYKHRLRLRAGLKFSESLNLMGPYLQYGSLPPYDHCGYEVAIHLLLNSLNLGRNDKNFTQWNSIRKMRTCYSNSTRASNQANQNTLAINDNKGRYTRIGKDPCGSFWFSRFLIGCRNRMGEI